MESQISKNIKMISTALFSIFLNHVYLQLAVMLGSSQNKPTNTVVLSSYRMYS